MGLERVTIGRFANEPNPFSGRGPGGLVAAKDGYFMVSTLETHQWEGLLLAMGNPEWSRAEWCKDPGERRARTEEIQAHIEKWAAGYTRDEIYHLAQANGTPAGGVRNVAEVMAWSQAREREFFRELDHPEVGTQTYPSAPYRFSETSWLGRAAPLLGEHNQAVYAEGLGYSATELARLVASGVI